MRNFFFKFVKKDYLRRVFAAAFLIFLLAEWGSHGIFNSRSVQLDEQAISAEEGHHDDPCRTMICSDSRRHDQQVPNFSPDITPHNGLLDRLSDLRLDIDLTNDPPLPYPNAHRLFRPVSPPFHPPELS